jgi:glycosyltransferase involved in cell wall biosynthesis
MLSGTSRPVFASTMVDRKIKIVFGVNDFLVGGMQNQFVEQLDFFDRERFDIILITLFDFPGQQNLYDELPVDLEVHRLDFKSIHDLSHWWELYKLLTKLKPDVVVSSLFNANTIFRVLQPLLGYVSIAREHNTYIDKKWWQRQTDRMLAFVSYRIVAVSTKVADFTAHQECIPREKFIVIHNGINALKAQQTLEKLSREELKNQLGFTAEDTLFLNIGRLVPQKNHTLLIDGFALFHKTHPAYKLVLVGDSTLRKDLEQYSFEKGLSNAVKFFGFRRDVWNFYKISDAFVSTSRIEGLSNNYLEALASGLPLLATKTAGTDELLQEGKNGFFIPEATPESVAQTMSLLLDANIDTMKKNALQSVENFDIRITVQKYSELFKKAAKQT